MIVSKFLNDKGYDTVDTGFYSMINIWKSWYISKVRKFHNYRIYNGKTHIKQQRLALGMAKKVSEDMANLLMNEKVKIVINDAATDEFVKQVLKDNNADVMLNEYQERKAYTGTVAYVPYIDNADVTESGEFLEGSGRIKINYVVANNIFPLSWENGKIIDCAFVFPKSFMGKQYANIQIHQLEKTEEAEQYAIYNYVVECTNGAGREIPQDKWGSIKGFEHLVPVITTGSRERQFVIDRLNIANNYDDDNPMGVALFANCIDQIKGCDVIYDSYINEFSLGKKRIFVSPQMLGVDPFGNPFFDENDIIFYKLPEDTLKDGNAIKEVNMEIRSEQHNKALNDNLNMVSSKCGFGTEHYKFENGNITTATQVISENSDLFRTIKKHEIVLDSVLKELIKIIIRLGIVIGQKANPDSEITIDFDDSIIEDKDKELDNDLRLLGANILRPEEVRAKVVGEDIEEAKANLPDQAEVIM